MLLARSRGQSSRWRRSAAPATTSAHVPAAGESCGHRAPWPGREGAESSAGRGGGGEAEGRSHGGAPV